MKFICDVCPLAASQSQTVVIGFYEEWVRHLLTPEHQASQNLVMVRKTYWPESQKVVIVKNMPKFEKSKVEFYVDVMMMLSEYGFVEAIYYGEKARDSAYIALQLYHTNDVPPTLSVDEVELELSLLVQKEGSSLTASKDRRRRKISSASSSSLSVSSLSDSLPVFKPSMTAEMNSDWTATISGGATQTVGLSPLSQAFSGTMSSASLSGNLIGAAFKKSLTAGMRIKYDKSTLLHYCGQKYMPKRFKEILEFPLDIVEQEAKIVDVDQLNQRFPRWCAVNDSGRGFTPYDGHAHGSHGARKPFNGNYESRWNKHVTHDRNPSTLQKSQS